MKLFVRPATHRVSPHFAGLFLVALLGLVPGLVQAKITTVRVDDSATQVLGSTVKMKWDRPSRTATTRAPVIGIVSVQVRLNVVPWRGRIGKIYMTLPAQSIGDVLVTWTSHGPLLPGAMRAGERSLVYNGMIDRPMIEDTIVLRIMADGQQLVGVDNLHFSFEMDMQTQ